MSTTLQLAEADSPRRGARNPTGILADRTLLLRIDPATGRARQDDRGEEPDRLEREAAAFFQTIADAYDALAAAEPQRIAVLDASRPPADVLAAALGALGDLLAPSNA